MCKKQAAVSHSRDESEIISLHVGVRMDGLPALQCWECDLENLTVLTLYMLRPSFDHLLTFV